MRVECQCTGRLPSAVGSAIWMSACAVPSGSSPLFIQRERCVSSMIRVSSNIWAVLAIVTVLALLPSRQVLAQVSPQPSAIGRRADARIFTPVRRSVADSVFVGKTQAGVWEANAAARRRNAALGALVGAGIATYAVVRACARSECMAVAWSVPIVAVGAGVGVLVGLLVTPVEGAPALAARTVSAHCGRQPQCVFQR